ncbi:MAG: RES family NAD+ phosphorylase [Myxococcota bacterium]
MPRSRRVGPTNHRRPPRSLSTTDLPLVGEAGPWWRIHRSVHAALFFGRTATYRFDAPDGAFGVLYAGDRPECAFIETFGHATGVRAVTTGDLAVRSLSEIRTARPLRLVDLTGPGLARMGADNRLCSGGGYRTAQAWSAALHAHPDAPDGLLYLACHDPSVRSVALFDRAESLCSEHLVGVLDDGALAGLLGGILDHYRFGLI